MLANGTTAPSSTSLQSMLGVSVRDNLKLAKKVESGLPYATLERVGRISGIPVERLRLALRIAPRTLSRRRRENRLSAEESDRLVSLSRLLAMAIDLFEGDVEAAHAWFTQPNRALSGTSPIEASATAVGSREVEALIGRLEHGVYI